jgi:ribosome maturation factor RimP
MRGQERLSKLIGPVVVGLGYELVAVEYDGRLKVLRVYIDHEQGITLDDCTRVSNQLSGFLDVEEPVQGHYQLEISSPGLDRPLHERAHFERFKGQVIRLQLVRAFDNQRKFKALLLGMAGDDVVLQDGEKTLHIPFENIEKARLVPQFDI